MGKVYLGFDTQNGMVVAVKTSKAEDKKHIDRFERESDILKNLNHPHIVKFIDTGIWNKTHYIVMDYIAGKQIGSEELDLKTLIRLISEIIDSVIYLHGRGIIHRDIKPLNILVSNNKATLVDFGIAKIQNKETISKAGSILGTLQYMSPEQVFGHDVDERSDLYSIGAVMYDLFTGRPPFVSNNAVDLIYKILSERPVDPLLINTNIPVKIRNVILRLLEKDASNRYQSAANLKIELDDFLEDTTVIEQKKLRVSPFYAPFVGRIKEIVQFDVMLDSIVSMEKKVMMITGKDGIGKSRLIEEFRSITLFRGHRFLICDPKAVDSGKPAISSVLDQLANHRIQFDQVLTNNYAFHIRDLSPVFADKLGLPQRKPLEFVAAFPDVIAQIIIKAFKDVPFVVAFEENLDPFSEKVLSILARIKSKYMGLVFISNKEKPTPIKVDFKIELGPLSRDELSKVAEYVSGTEMSGKDLEILEKKTGGNPLFTLNILRQMQSESSTVSLTSMPADITEMFGKKISKLTEISKKCLFKMSLLGKPQTIEKLQIMFDLNEFEMFIVAKELFKADLITEKLFGRELCLDTVSGILNDLILAVMTKEEHLGMHQELAHAILQSVINDQDPMLGEAGKHLILAGQVIAGSSVIINSCTGLVERNLFEVALGYLEYMYSKIDTLDPEIAGRFWLMYLKSLVGAGRIKEAYASIPDVERIIEDPAVQNTVKAELLMQIGNINCSELHFEDVRNYCLRAIFYADTQTQSSLMSDIFHLLSGAEWNLGDYGIAYEYSQKEEEFAYKSNDENKLISAFIMNGITLVGLEHDVSAKEKFQSAYALAQVCDNVSGQLNAMNNIIEFDFKNEKYDEVIKKLTEVKSKAAYIHDYRNYYSAIMNLIMVYKHLGKFEQAHDTAEDILKYYDETGCNYQIVNIYDFLTRYHLFKCDMVELEKYCRLMFDAARKNNQLESELSVVLSIACLFHLKNDPDKSTKLLEKVLSSKRYSNCNSLYDAYSKMSILSILFEDYDRAFTCFKTLLALVSDLKEPDQYLNQCLVPKTLAFVLSGCFANNINPVFQTNGLDLPIVDGQFDYHKLVNNVRQIIIDPYNDNVLDCYKPESVLGYATMLNAIGQKRVFLDKHLIREALRIIEETFCEMFTHKFKYLKDELSSVKFKLTALLHC